MPKSSQSAVMDTEKASGERLGTYIATGHHLLGNVFDASLILGLAALISDWIHRFEIRLQELDVSSIRQADIFALANGLPFPVRSAEGVE